MKRRQRPIKPSPRPPAAETPDERRGLAALAILSLLAGAASGLIGAVFRRLLIEADQLRDTLISWSHNYNVLGLAVVVLLAAAATGFAGWLVRRFSPEASGSGIPHVEAVLHETAPPAPYVLLPVKFVGGLTAIGAGLALGREGPTIQMGASVAHLVGRIFRLSLSDSRILLAAGAGAGLATAFNAPIAGSVFVLEELLRRFDTRITIATLGASAAAIAVSRQILGDAPDFVLAPLPYPTTGSTPIYIALGLFVGVLGIGYNRAIVGCLALADHFSKVRVESRARWWAARSGYWRGSLPRWSAAAIRSPSGRCTTMSCLCGCRPCSRSASRWVPCRMRPARRAASLLRCLCWAPRPACFSALTPASGSPPPAAIPRPTR